MALDPEERTLYVSNLDRNVSEELLYELFLQAGPIERVNIPKDRDIGFITFKHESSIEYAIELFKGTRLFKRELMIKKKGERSNNQENQNNQQMNNFMRGVWDQNMAMAMNMNMNMNMNMSQYNPNPAQAQIAQLLSLSSQFFGANNQNFNPQSNRNNFNEDNSKGHWSNRSRPYDRNSRNYSARSREPRDRNNKGRDYSNNSYRDRNRKY